MVFQQTRLEQLNMSAKEARKGDLKGKREERGEKKASERKEQREETH